MYDPYWNMWGKKKPFPCRTMPRTCTPLSVTAVQILIILSLVNGKGLWRSHTGTLIHHAWASLSGGKCAYMEVTHHFIKETVECLGVLSMGMLLKSILKSEKKLCLLSAEVKCCAFLIIGPLFWQSVMLLIATVCSLPEIDRSESKIDHYVLIHKLLQNRPGRLCILQSQTKLQAVVLRHVSRFIGPVLSHGWVCNSSVPVGHLSPVLMQKS